MPFKKKYPWNVLIFPAASEVGLEINMALRDSKEVVLHGAATAPPNLAMFQYSRLHTLPHIENADCLSSLQKLIKDHKIDAIIPAHDDALLWLAEHTNDLDALVLTAPVETCRICRSKSQTYKALDRIVPVPRLLSHDTSDFPVFVKPDRGQGSQRARRLDNRAALAVALADEPDLIITDYFPGPEYTVDCYTSKEGPLLFAQARARHQTKAGIATLTSPAQLDFVREWAESITGHMPMRGAWFFQIKTDVDGDFRLIEAAPRIAGSMALHRAMGVNFPLLSLYEAAGFPITVEAFSGSLRMGRSLDIKFIYDQPIEALYVDFDDTLVLRDKVNTRLVSLIFQCRNRSIPVKLVSRHKGAIEDRLRYFRLMGIFDAVHHLKEGESKASIIAERYAVLIDDSFRERCEVSKTKNIRCFDAAAAVCLLDERA